MARTAVAILSTENLRHNLQVLKQKVGPAKIIAMVKANAYGHGIRSVARRLDGLADMLGVASIDEGMALREAGVKAPILLMEGVFESRELIASAAQNFHVMFHHDTQLAWLEKVVLPRPIEAWLKINTGMGRLGFDMNQVPFVYDRLNQSLKVARPVRIVSHFASADQQNDPLNEAQVQQFAQLTKKYTGPFSLCNSAGIFHFDQHHYDYVRPGLALYGVSPISGLSAASLGLKPVMTVQTSLIAVQEMEKGAPVGYGGRYRCPDKMPVGVVAFGYGDGYPVAAQDGTPVRVNDVICPLIGRVSMDMLTVDLRPCPKATVGDPVVLWGEGLPIEDVVAHAPHNITWNVLTGVQNRVRFLWTEEEAPHRISGAGRYGP